MTSGIIRFNQDACRDLDASLKREWLETNGLGGFSSSTIIGLNTRRYHGLLTAATKPPVGRMVLLSKFEETLVIDDKRIELSANRYPGVVHPQGYQYLAEFRLDPFPVFTYRVDGFEVEKRVFMAHGENTTVIEYEVRGPAGCVLELRPLIAFRDYHSTTHRNEAINTSVQIEHGVARVEPYPDLPGLYFAHNGSEPEVTGYWYDNFEYSEEQARGLDYREDLFNPFVIPFNCDRQTTATVIASTERHASGQASDLRLAEIRRRLAVRTSSPSSEPLIQALVAAADQFIVKRGDFKTIIAGYHWFTDWGRDTMVALPGLALITGRAEIARSILLAFANSLSQGMLPNRFPDTGEEPEYNTVDATLWFFEAVRALLQYTGDYIFVREHLYEKLKNVIEWHLRGTRFRIRVDSDGLLACGEPGVQLTWMDAKVGEWVVTPRYGKPVEVQALWYNALLTLEDLARRFGDDETRVFLEELAGRARASFNNAFWNEDAGCLYDVIDGDRRDASIRPNQVFAVSLTHAILANGRARQVVDVLQRELLTPLGLRSLSPGDAQYRPRYEGSASQRDSAYHQGTVWTWLMGPFITAYVKANDRSIDARRQAAFWLEAFSEHMQTAGLGQLSELADAESPYAPKGCIAQAWSVAELLRAAAEDVFMTKSIVTAA
jgi:predicted glycogen debranching enzyme